MTARVLIAGILLILLGCVTNHGDPFVYVSGYVIDEGTYASIDSAFVSINDPSPSAAFGYTDSAGYFRVETIAVKPFVVYAGAPGYAVDSVSVHDVKPIVDSVVIRLSKL